MAAILQRKLKTVATQLRHSVLSLKAWSDVGAALAIGKAHALRVTGASRAWGSAYSRCFGEWMREHGFGTMNKNTRSWALALFENAAAALVVPLLQYRKHRQRDRLGKHFLA
jgi:hypothetical protein